MIKMILVCFLVFLSGEAFAEWEQIANSDTFDAYIDKTTIRNKGKYIKAWELRDYHKAQKGINKTDPDYLSVVIRLEYDCAEEMSRFISTTYYSENMGEGTVTSTLNYVGAWNSVIPRSIGEASLNAACAQ